MILTQKLYTAINRAAVLHDGQVRRGEDKVPYITHLFGVAILLDYYGADEDTIVAGIFHDSLEDVAGYTEEKLSFDIGAHGASIVQEVTEPQTDSSLDPITNWKMKKTAYLETLSSGTPSALMVAAADKIHNTESIIYRAHEDKDTFLCYFTQDMRERNTWFLDSIDVLLKGKIPENMYQHFVKVKEELRAIFK